MPLAPLVPVPDTLTLYYQRVQKRAQARGSNQRCRGAALLARFHGQAGIPLPRILEWPRSPSGRQAADGGGRTARLAGGGAAVLGVDGVRCWPCLRPRRASRANGRHRDGGVHQGAAPAGPGAGQAQAREAAARAGGCQRRIAPGSARLCGGPARSSSRLLALAAPSHALLPRAPAPQKVELLKQHAKQEDEKVGKRAPAAACWVLHPPRFMKPPPPLCTRVRASTPPPPDPQLLDVFNCVEQLQAADLGRAVAFERGDYRINRVPRAGRTPSRVSLTQLTAALPRHAMACLLARQPAVPPVDGAAHLTTAPLHATSCWDHVAKALGLLASALRNSLAPPTRDSVSHMPCFRRS